MAFDIRGGFKRSVSVAFTKADGSPGLVEGIPAWTLSDPAIAGLVVAADGMSAEVSHMGGVGEVILSMSADGDLGAGVFPIAAVETFTMMAPIGATAGVFAVGDEVPV